MRTKIVGSFHLLIMSIPSFLRVGTYLYWTYWFNEFILPVIFITEQGLFLMIQVPILLAALDLILVLSFLIIRDKTWILLVAGSAAASIYSWLFLLNFTNDAGTFGIVLIITSAVQLSLLIPAILQVKEDKVL